MLCKISRSESHGRTVLLARAPDRHGVDSNSVVRFFVYGGILALPYQFYHHAHKMLCDHDRPENFFFPDANPVKCNHDPIITLKPTLTVPCAVLY